MNNYCCTFCGVDLTENPDAYEGHFGVYCGPCLKEANRLWDRHLLIDIVVFSILVFAIAFQ